MHIICLKSIIKLCGKDFKDKLSFVEFIITILTIVLKNIKIELNCVQTEIIKVFLCCPNPFEVIEEQELFKRLDEKDYKNEKIKKELNNLTEIKVLNKSDIDGIIFYCLNEKVLLKK